MFSFKKLVHSVSIWKGQRRQKGQEWLTRLRLRTTLMMLPQLTDKILCVCVCGSEGGRGARVGQVFLCISACAAGVVHACVPLAIIGDPFNHESFSWNEISLADDTKHKGLLSHIFFLNLQTLPRKCLSLVFPLLPETAHCGLCATWWRNCISFRSQDC